MRKQSVFSKSLNPFKIADQHVPLKIASIIAGIYTILGVCWILFSDNLLALWASDKKVYVFISSIKGIIYVVASALVILLMVYNALKVINKANNIMKTSYIELENTNKKLAESENFNKAIINKMLNAYALHRIILDENGEPCDYEYLDVNPSFEQFTGIAKENIIGRRYKEAIKASNTEESYWVNIYGKVAITGEPVSFENYTAAFDKWVVVSAYSPKKDYFITVFSDISDLKKNEVELREKHDELSSLYEELTASEEELREQFIELTQKQKLLKISEERFRLSAEGSNDMIWDIDLENEKQYFSDRWDDLLGHEINESEDLLKRWISLIHPDEREHVLYLYKAHLEGQSSFFICECRMMSKNNAYKWFLIRGKALFNDNGKAVRIAGSLTDIDDRKNYEYQLRENAYHDSLTGLPNRRALYEDIDNHVKNHPHKTRALFYIDSDNFKFINDTMGHSIGDILIKRMGERLTSLFKSFYNKVYRLGGDEFVFIADYDQIDEIYEYANEIIRSFSSPFEINESILRITVSIGIATYPVNAQNIQELVRNADIAMYKAKELGKNCYTLFSKDMHEKIMERMLIEKHLRGAIENNELDVYYQPQIEAATGTITGFEALLRWKNSELGFVAPLKFIGVAEETRLINPIGVWVLQKACTFIKNIHKIEGTDISIAVNISIFQLIQEDFVDVVEKALASAGLSPEHLELEITESILMDSYNAISPSLQRLKSLGIKIALDDFGKGYSSLSYLQQLPIDTLKIDKCFIDSIHQDKDNANLTGMIVKLGQNMGLTVLAEGVEEQEQMNYLTKNGCHKIQGYLISKPLPENEIIKFYKGWKQTHP